MGLKDWLPDFKGALNSFYEEKLKGTIETKSSEFQTLTQQFILKVSITNKPS